MTDVTKEDFKELKDAVIKLTDAVTTLIAREEKKEADIQRLTQELKDVNTRQYKLETETIPKLMQIIAANKQIIILVTVVMGSLMTGAIGMFFRMAGQ